MKNNLKQATQLIESGDVEGGRHLLIELLKSEPKNDTAWLWLATVVETNDLRQECLQEALKHNPRNKTASRALAKLQGQSESFGGYSAQLKPTQPAIYRSIAQFKYRRGFLFLMACMLVMGLGMIALNIAVIQEELIYQTEGQVTHATALEFFKAAYTAGGRCSLTYQFVVKGAAYEGYNTFPCAQWDELHTTRRLQVQYAAGNPHQSRYYPDRTNLGALSALGFVMGGFLSIYGGSQLVSGIRRRNNGQRL